MTGKSLVPKVRGFDWRLAPLQRKLEWEVDAARMQLAGALARSEATARALREIQAVQQQAAQDARAAVSLRADPLAHQRMLRYLVGVAGQVEVATDEEKKAGEGLAAAREELLERQRRLDVLLRARGNALDAHLQERARGAQVEADATWLVLRELHRGAAGQEESA